MARPIFEGCSTGDVRSEIGIHRFGEPADIVGEVAFLANDSGVA